MNRVLCGRVWRFEGILDVDREICAMSYNLRHTGKSYEEQLRMYGEQCLTKVDPDFPKKVRQGDFTVGGPGFGYGHDHDHACLALRGAGVGAVLIEAANTIFKRLSIANGLPVVEVKGIMNATKTGDELEVDLAGGTVKSLTTGRTLTFIPYPDFILDILEAGGVYQLLEKQVKSGLYAASGASQPEQRRV